MRHKIEPYPGGWIATAAQSLWRLLKKNSNSVENSEKFATSGANTKKETVTTNGNDIPDKLLKTFNGFQNFQNISIYVHGSWADESNIEFSDIDDLVIYNEHDFQNSRELRTLKNWLNKVDMRFCRIDPLQHHGHWILSKKELSGLDESYIPITVVNGAFCIQGPSSLSATIDIEKTRIGLRRNVVATLQNISDLFEKYQNNKINLYEMKALVSSFLLMPAYLFQLNNRGVSKKWAIENINTLLPASSCNIIYISEEIRKNWGISLSGWRYTMFRIAPFLFTNPHLYRIIASKFAPRFMSNQLPILAQNDVDDFVAHCQALLCSE